MDGNGRRLALRSAGIARSACTAPGMRAVRGKDMTGVHNVRIAICLSDVSGDIHSPKHITRAEEDGSGIANPGPQGPQANGYYMTLYGCTLPIATGTPERLRIWAPWAPITGRPWAPITESIHEEREEWDFNGGEDWRDCHSARGTY